MTRYQAQFRLNGQPVNLVVRADDMESALRQLKRDNPQGSGFCVWNPDHVPPRGEGAA